MPLPLLLLATLCPEEATLLVRRIVLLGLPPNENWRRKLYGNFRTDRRTGNISRQHSEIQ